jgi:adenylosuccinate lyase
VIRRHSLEAARAIKNGGTRNDLFDRLASDPAFGLGLTDIREAADPAEYVGRAPEQVDEFLAEVVDPALAGVSGSPAEREEPRV